MMLIFICGCGVVRRFKTLPDVRCHEIRGSLSSWTSSLSPLNGSQRAEFVSNHWKCLFNYKGYFSPQNPRWVGLRGTSVWHFISYMRWEPAVLHRYPSSTQCQASMCPAWGKVTYLLSSASPSCRREESNQPGNTPFTLEWRLAVMLLGREQPPLSERDLLGRREPFVM